MLATRQARINRGQQAVARPLPPPVTGWNARDGLEGMKPTDAVLLENWFPRETDVTVRGGYELHCNTGEGAHSVETLAEWKASGSRKLIAACNGKLIDVTTSTPSTLASGFTSNRWVWVNFSERLFMVNGVDDPRDYDGASIATTSWSGSGLTNANLSYVAVFKERLFFVEKNTLNFWYGDLQNITGTLTKFPLKYTGSFGGVLVSIGILSIDGGAGVDDLIVFYLSSGEVVVYQGSDPGDASDFAKVGTFFIRPPIPNVPLLKYGNELVAITKSAYTPVSRVMPFGRTQDDDLDLSKKISGAVEAAVQSYKDNAGWQAIHYAEGSKLIVNVPRSTASFDQHVMNTSTKAWCKFTGWDFPCFGIFNDLLYAGSTDGKVHQCDVGYDDDGDAIVADGQTAWNYFGVPNQLKTFTMARVIFGAVSDPAAVMSIGTDFTISVPTSTVETADVESGGIWDIAVWDVDTWGGATQAIQGWQGTSGMGYSASMRLRVSLTDQNVTWRSSTIIFKPAGLV